MNILSKVITASEPLQNIGDLSNAGLSSHGDPVVGVSSVANCDVELSAGWCDSCKVNISFCSTGMSLSVYNDTSFSKKLYFIQIKLWCYQ